MTDGEEGRIPYKWVVASVFVIGMFMDTMDVTVVNVALPTLGRQFHAGTSTIEWVVIGYLLSLAVWIPASGWIGDRLGTKKVFLFALASFTLASAACGQARNLHQLIAFRVLQGVGGGMLTPVGTAMLYRAFKPHERAQASTVLLIPTVLAPAVGPIIGGLLIDSLSWRWIFYINLPAGILGLVIGARGLREHAEPTAGRFDFPGFVLSGAGLASLLYALSQGPSHGWRSTSVLGLGTFGVAAFTLLVVVELRTPEPMLDLRLYRDRMFRSSSIVMIMLFSGFIGVLFLLPLFLQGDNLFRLSPLQSGLTTFPQAVGMILSSQVVGRVYHRVGPRRLILAGVLGFGITSCGFLAIDLGTSLWWVRGILLLRGISMAFAFVPLQAASYANIKPADTGRASALYSTQRQVAAALGVALTATVLVSRTKALTAHVTQPTALAHAQVAAFHDAFAAAIIVAFAAAFVSLLIHDADAAATIRRPNTDPGEELTVALPALD
jgi:EmrB/QacA subfamily drug resistance transporter